LTSTQYVQVAEVEFLIC